MSKHKVGAINTTPHDVRKLRACVHCHLIKTEAQVHCGLIV